MDIDKDTAWKIFDQYQEEYEVYKTILTPDVQESCEAQWSKSNRMLRFAGTDQDFDEVIQRAKNLIKWCEHRYWENVKSRNPIESKDYVES